MMTTSVVIASHNKHVYLARTLACLIRQTVPPDEVIVVDDASSPSVAALPGMTRLIRREGLPHLQAARNCGIAAARGELILLLDDDCLVWDEWVSAHLRRHLELSPSLVVGSVRRVEYEEVADVRTLPGLEQSGEHRFFTRSYELLRAGVPPWNAAPCSNNASVEREVLSRLGGYGPDYLGWGVDDVDLTYRIVAEGVPLAIDAAPVVHHQEHPRMLERQSVQEQRNLWTFARKHGFWPYGIPPATWNGPHRYPVYSSHFDVSLIRREAEPPTIYVGRSLPEEIRRSAACSWTVGPRGGAATALMVQVS